MSHAFGWPCVGFGWKVIHFKDNRSPNLDFHYRDCVINYSVIIFIFYVSNFWLMLSLDEDTTTIGTSTPPNLRLC